MNNETIFTAVIVEDSTTYTLVEICQKYSIPKELVLEMAEQGLFNVQSTAEENLTLDRTAIRRMESAFRLHRDLGVNLAGVALALDLLDEIEAMRNELDVLRRHF
jgi:chaperone modulatory protein CbpM